MKSKRQEHREHDLFHLSLTLDEMRTIQTALEWSAEVKEAAYAEEALNIFVFAAAAAISSNDY